MKEKAYIGIDIGGTKIAAGIVTSRGVILQRYKESTPQDAKTAVIYQAVLEVVRKLLQAGGVKPSQLHGIGIGVPGIVKPNRKEILITPNTNLSAFPLAYCIEKSLGVPAFLGNDVNLGLLGEKWLGAGRGVANIVGIFPGTGVGGAIILEGRLVTGAQGGAGELGHMILDWDSPYESAGVQGSLEALASRRAIEREIQQAVRKGEKTIVTSLLGGDIKLIKSKIIAKALKKKDPVVTRVVNNAAKILGKTCISIRHILNPDMIILGGGVIEACGDYLLPRIKRISNADPFFKGIDKCRIVASTLGDDAVILGAVALLQQQVVPKKIKGTVTSCSRLTAKKGRVAVYNRVQQKSFYIRADGKMKILNGAASTKDFLPGQRIGAGLLKKICKKGPCHLIVGSKGIKPRVSAEGRQFLKEMGISCKVLSITEALKEYKASCDPKAIFIWQQGNKPR